MRVALLGFGLIGGSIARSLRRSDADWTIAAWSPSGDGPGAALAAGIVDAAPTELADAVRGAGVVILAGPPLATLELIDGLRHGPAAEALGQDSVVTDVASTKAMIVERADAAGLRFVGGHPMAGREISGWAASSADLFDERPWIVVPGAHAAAADIDLVCTLVRACGARPVDMAAPEHDAAVAAISHLPLLLAAALVEAVAGPGGEAGDGERRARPDWPAAAAIAGSGWQGMTRLARGDVEMGAGIVATNAPAIAARVRDLRAVLDRWLADLEREGGPDPGAVAGRLGAARRHLEEAP
jgi:prephenate dehydrogenase